LVFAHSDSVNTGDNYLASIAGIRLNGYNTGGLIFNTYSAGSVVERARFDANGTLLIG